MSTSLDYIQVVFNYVGCVLLSVNLPCIDGPVNMTVLRRRLEYGTSRLLEHEALDLAQLELHIYRIAAKSLEKQQIHKKKSGYRKSSLHDPDAHKHCSMFVHDLDLLVQKVHRERVLQGKQAIQNMVQVINLVGVATPSMPVCSNTSSLISSFWES